ncbi:MAG: ferrochelatase [Deltaproteobacteria bacterium]|nr:ferrochelatase [Deltaproteobacteria bacterium]
MPPIDAVLLLAFGGPERPEDVRPFLDEVLRGRPVPRERYEAVVRHYEAIGGRSPLSAWTFRQARALAAALERDGPRLPVYVGMRSWTPTVAETLASMQRDGVRRALAVILAPHRAEVSFERYRRAVDDGRAALGTAAPAIDYARPWFDHPEFIASVSSRVRDALAVAPDDTEIVFTAHSIPCAMADRSPYVRELETSCRLVAAALGRPFAIAYQSRSGGPREPWLEPDVNVLLRERAAQGVRHVVLVPIGFVCDHVEVLYDLDVEARATAAALGLGLTRAETANDHPAFIRMLAALVRAHAGDA